MSSTGIRQMGQAKFISFLTCAATLFGSGPGNQIQAATDSASDHWNIMVIPGKTIAFSAAAKNLFNQRCASCHSKDGRAQTPVARQRHVRDLSECELDDAELVRQILNGTASKTNTFKMPAFQDKLSREEVESLVPLVKAFRSASRINDRNSNPRLAGIFYWRHVPLAILEAGVSSNQYFILHENESHAGVSLLKLHPKLGTAKISVKGKESMLRIVPQSETNAKRKAGFFNRLGEAFVNAPRKLVLSDANLDVTLFLYSQFTGRTILRHPMLPAVLVDLDVFADTPEDSAQQLKAALLDQGITTMEDGDKFILVFPTANATDVKPQSLEYKTRVGTNGPSKSFPGGLYANFPNATHYELDQLYHELTGHARSESPSEPTSCTASFTTQTALTKDEGAYALKTLTAWCDALGNKLESVSQIPKK